MDLEPGESILSVGDIYSIVVPDIVDTVKQEQEIEEANYLQAKHKEIRKWYREHKELHTKFEICLSIIFRYGKFPLFWEELREWDHWKEVEAEYNAKKAEEQELEEENNKKGRWSDGSKRLKRSRWENDRRYIQPGTFTAICQF